MSRLFGQNLLRLFTLEEANLMIPLVKKSLKTQKELLKKIKQLTEQVEKESVRSKKQHLKTALKSLIDEMNVELSHLEELGCQIKSVEKGLVDFPSLVNNEIVYLCWKNPEKEITHWHRVTDGFAGRVKIDPSVHFSKYWEN